MTVLTRSMALRLAGWLPALWALQLELQLVPAAADPFCSPYGACNPPSGSEQPTPAAAAPRRAADYGNYWWLPAPPGHIPACASPGATYCDKAENYPNYAVLNLVEKWKYDFPKLLTSETRDVFSSPVPDGPYGPYGRHHDSYGPEGLYGPYGPYGPFGPFGPYGPYYGPQKRTHQETNHSRPSDREPDHQQGEQQQGYPERTYRLDLSQTSLTSAAPPVSQWDSATRWWDRNTRTKRQANFASTLCPTTVTFVAPKAAVNTKGNWMYIVNLPEQNQAYSQLVGAETCISSKCDDLCSLPLGYSSRCVQKYVQKRLVALGGTGDHLYTDTFLFPHCCVCEITRAAGGKK